MRRLDVCFGVEENGEEVKEKGVGEGAGGGRAKPEQAQEDSRTREEWWQGWEWMG